MEIKTTDLCDTYAVDLQVAAPIFKDYGGNRAFGGPISTVRVLEDNVLVRAAIEQPGQGRVLVIDGGGSLRCALVGDMLVAMAQQNGWVGIVVHGCIRDTAAVAQLAIGVKALAANPLRSGKHGGGERDLPVAFAGVRFVPGHFLYADEDGLVVAEKALE